MTSASYPSSVAGETALIVVVPEVETLVERFRVKHDPAAAQGMPAHVTVLYPFLPLSKISASVLWSLDELFSRLPRFRAEFPERRRFPGVLYLAPFPDAPFRRMTQAAFNHFPDAPPYGGQFSDVVPHLTVAHAADPAQLTQIEAEFDLAARDRLPVHTTVQEVVLVEKREGRWRSRMAFSLRGSNR